MDAEILQGFIEEAESYLPEMRTSITAYVQDSTNIENLQNAQKQANTVKGAALMVGLVEVGELCGEFEKELESIISASNPLSKKQVRSLLEKVTQLEAVLSLARESVGDIALSENIFSEELLEDFAANEAESTEETVESFEDFEIDAEMMEVFALEAEDHLQNITNNLAILQQTPNNREALLEIRRSSHTLKGSAGIVGFKKLSTLAHRVEDLLDYFADNEIEGDTKVFELLLASTDCLEAVTRGENSPELEQKIAEIYQRFDELLDLLQAPEATQISAVSTSEPVAEFTTSQVNLVLNSSTIDSEEGAETAENQAQLNNPGNRSVIRVSLDRLDGLVRLVSEMVISRSMFEQRISELEQQIQELNHTTSRLRRSTNKLEVNFEAQTLSNNFGVQKYGAVPQKNSLSAWENGEFDTLEFDQYTEFHQTTRELIEATGDTSAIHNDLDNLMSNLGLLFDNQHHLIDEMQESLLRLRMVPLGSLAARLQRAVRITASEEGKQADLVIENENIEIDTEIIDAFIEPLIHLLRNAVSHGIEPTDTRKILGKTERGKITLKAYSEGTHIVFVISDDGRGISPQALIEKAVFMRFISEEKAAVITEEEAFSLIFLPGLTTTDEVTQVSGRGLGMNVVKSSIARRQGDIFVSSEPQKGTTFTVRLPMSLAVTRVLLVKADEQTFAFPLKLIKQVLEVSAEDLKTISQEKTLKHNGKNYKFAHFNEIINLPVLPNRHDSKTSLLLLETHDKHCALMIDELLRPEEVVIKPLGNLLRNIPDIIGATILGDGSVVPVLDLVHLLKKKPSKGKKANPAETKPKEFINILIVDDSPSVRQVNSNIVKNAGWKPILAKDGIEALEIIQSFRELPDIILTDVEMPRMDGYELLASLKRQEEFREIPVVMITSRSGDKHRRKAYDLGVSEYVTKPYEESVLIVKIKKLLEPKTL